MENINFSHYSVMLNECIDALNIKPDGIYVDGTTGGGGHSYEIASRLSEGGRLICIDQDSDALLAAGKRLAPFSDRVTFVKSNFSDVAKVLDDLGIEKIDGLLLDLGVSSYQLDTPERGFSYNSDAPLDMRMDKDAALSAYEVVNTYSESDLRRILFDFGEESFAPKIASAIVAYRAEKPVETTFELTNIIKSVMPKKLLVVGHHPAKKTFQAIRIEVNSELSVIAPTIENAVERLNEGGRLAIITFHSLEDRCVKQTYAKCAQGCTCPPEFPICVCGNKPKIALVSKKPILPSKEELEANHRSHSAKLRVAQKI
jgi:16S rRNA (cytosine1402-N4)-methyltransferase